MALTKFDIISRAMTKLDASTVASFSDGTREAEVAEQLYEGVFHAELTTKQWNFNTSNIQLSQEVATPTDGTWTYQFSKPSDCLLILNIINSNGNSVNYVVEGSKIYSNTDVCYAKYLSTVSESQLPAYFVDLLVAKLTFEFARPIIGSSSAIQQAATEYDGKYKLASRADAYANPPQQVLTPTNNLWVNATGNAQIGVITP